MKINVRSLLGGSNHLSLQFLSGGVSSPETKKDQSAPLGGGLPLERLQKLGKSAPRRKPSLEQNDPHALPDAQRWFGLLIRFSLKESLYKALDPVLERYIGFDEAEVHPDMEGKASIRLLFDSDRNSFEVDARYDWVHEHLLTSVRVRDTRGATA